MKNNKKPVSVNLGSKTNQEQPHRQAIILAAGGGSRMNGESRALPKCLLEVGGRQLLDHQLDALAVRGIDDVCVITGYRADLIERSLGKRATTIHNKHWDKTNSLYSLSLSREWVIGDLLVMNCDVLAHPTILDRLLNDENGSRFVYDSSSGNENEHMKVEFAADGSLASMSKSLSPDAVHGENVGMLYFAASDTEALFNHADDVLAHDGLKRWLASAVERLAGSATLSGIDICDLPWTEIDFPEDLRHARANIWPKICTARSAKQLSSGIPDGQQPARHTANASCT